MELYNNIFIWNNKVYYYYYYCFKHPSQLRTQLLDWFLLAVISLLLLVSYSGNHLSLIIISISQVEYSMSQNAKNANSQETSFPDLHTINSNNVSEISGEIQRNGTNTPTDNRSENSSNEMLNDVPGCLPEYVEVNRPQLVNWNRNSDGEIITINSSLIDEAYTEITTWRKNTFLVPYGKTGRDFIDQLTKHIDDNHATPCSESRYCSLSCGAQET